MIKVLHIVSSLNYSGGVQSMLYNYYKNMNTKNICFDFIVHGDKKGEYEFLFEEMGSTIIHVKPKKNSLRKNIFGMKNVIKGGNYDVLHCHQNFLSFVPLYLGWRYKVPVRISHSHGCKEVETISERVQTVVFRFLNKCFANFFFSCGVDAGKWLHGKKWLPNKKNLLMNNAIDVDRFSYNKKNRERYRKKLGLEDKIVLIHVGRFSEAKNHLFLVNIMEKLLKIKNNYILLLIGDGPTEKAVKKYVEEKHLSNNIVFMGLRKDVPEIMNLADILLLPSKHEGLPVTLVEAQSTGLFSFVSDKVTREIVFTDLIEYLPINNVEPWVKEIADKNIYTRESKKKDIEKAGYSITVQAKNYSKWLQNSCGDYSNTQ